ncbi:telomere repeats-binding bouquet formation protein 1 [Halichoeres trimaculatus]|uniref:telomere repeats-binding bouquet formation protein 1 n=1 Tax=Halichoeres trimaculatus TaxID=147232 RepID=UPI003D9EB04A
MKCPDLQKQALLAIHSICENREDNVDFLRQMGGVPLMYSLSKSSIVHPDVKETALFTLSTLAEANVYCKNSLCRKETFSDLANWLMKEDVPLTQKRVSVYLLSVLVANNRPGQTLAQNTGCLDILLDIFRTTFPLSPEATSRAFNASQTSQLWASVCSALCGCVNNPQNEEGQRICVTAFPRVKIWLQQIALSRTEIYQSVCSFIAMTVANNSYVQESFFASGGLKSLSLALVHLASAADTSLLSCQLSVTLSKTLSACITDNPSLAAGLAQYGLVSQLFFLLASPHLDPEEKSSVLLTLGHCTMASEEHQSQLVQCGGLPLIITLLTEDTSEEVRKAAMFILQTCRQATLSLEVPGLSEKQGMGENVEPITSIEGFRSSARELLHRIDLLEKRQAKAQDVQEDIYPSKPMKGFDQLSKPPALPLPLQQRENIQTILAACRLTSTPNKQEARGKTNFDTDSSRNITMNDSQLRSMSFNLQEEKAQTIGEDVWCPTCNGTGALPSLEGDRAHQTVANEMFKPPAPVKRSVQKEVLKENHVEVLQEHGTNKKGVVQKEGHSASQIRCAGCVLPFEEVTSRTFSSLQSSCRHSCDMHKAFQKATEQFRAAHRSLLCKREPQNNTVEQACRDSGKGSGAEPWRNWDEVCLTPIHKAAGKGKNFLQDNNWKKHNGITLTPRFRGATRGTSTSHNKTGPGLTPLKRSRLVEDTERREENNSGLRALDEEMKTQTDHNPTRRKRRNFSQAEVHYLLRGVKNLGFSWNSILWSYPFQPGRNNVDLAQKYRQLMKAEAASTGCAKSQS